MYVGFFCVKFFSGVVSRSPHGVGMRVHGIVRPADVEMHCDPLFRVWQS